MRIVLTIIMSMLFRRAITPLVALALVTAACGSDETTDSSAEPSNGAPTVVATTTIWADVVRNVACDGLADVRTIVPAGGDPHSFEPSLKDRETMSSAALIVANGLGLEESMTDIIGAVESEGVPVVRVGESVETLPAGDEDHADESGEEEHADEEHGTDDPHIWFDPTRVAATLPAMADALAATGLDRTALDACVADFAEQLATLDADVAATVASIPVDQRLLVTNHDSLSYFADRYGFEILGSVIPSPSSLSATNPAQLEELAGIVEETGVPTIFAETQHSSTDTQALAARVGDVDVVTLQTDTLGEPDSDTATYVSWLTMTTQTIVDALRTST
jgi:zinc/manganese transport system substrate-binding protein